MTMSRYIVHLTYTDGSHDEQTIEAHNYGEARRIAENDPAVERAVVWGTEDFQ